MQMNLLHSWHDYARLLASRYNWAHARPLKMVFIQHIKAKPSLVVVQALP